MKFILCSLLFISTFLFADNTAVKADAKKMGKDFTKYYEKNLDSQIFNPMTNENSQISTKDGSQSGTAYMTCGETKPFAKISYSGNSDITINVQLNVDNNDDNGYEATQSFNGVSGITATGIIKCTAGTFSNCKYYNWNYNNSDLIYLTQTNRNNSADAYCINSSCGSLAASQKSKILGDIAGALTSSFSGYSSYTVTQTNVTSNYIELYGQNYENCSDSNATQFNSSTTDIPGSLDGESQMNNSNVAYTTLTDVVKNENKNEVTASDYSDMQDIANTSVRSADTSYEDERIITYTYEKKNDNGTTTIQNLSSAMDVDLDDDTEYCMVAWEKKYTGVATDGTVRGTDDNGVETTIEEEFRECVDGVCPYTEPEYIKYDCGNTDDSLGEAISALATLKELQDDISCSTK
jgi:hypothetical protein